MGRGFPLHEFYSAVKGVLDLPENQEVVIIGTLYKEMKLKPSILAEYTKVHPFPIPSPSLLPSMESVEVILDWSSLEEYVSSFYKSKEQRRNAQDPSDVSVR